MAGDGGLVRGRRRWGVEANGAEAGLAGHVGDGDQVGAAADEGGGKGVAADVGGDVLFVEVGVGGDGLGCRWPRGPTAAASHQQALDLFRHLGDRQGQAEVLNSLGELASRTTDGGQARDHHAQALAIARDLGTPRRKHAPWKASAAAICATATPAKPLRQDKLAPAPER